jgi:hypothetical protein
MMHEHYFHIRLPQDVDDPIRAQNQFANYFLAELGDDPS